MLPHFTTLQKFALRWDEGLLERLMAEDPCKSNIPNLNAARYRSLHWLSQRAVGKLFQDNGILKNRLRS
jgi:hypothetical protein